VCHKKEFTLHRHILTAGVKSHHDSGEDEDCFHVSLMKLKLKGSVFAEISEI
jgi:hypothetical protein